MKVVGRVESLWRYPVKSMRGEELNQLFAGFSGVYGDRFYAFLSSAAPKRFPYFTGREKETMLLYRPAYRNAEYMLQPPNLPEAQARGPGLTAIYPDPTGYMVDVQTPSGDRLAINDPALLEMLREGVRERHELTLHRSHRSMTDCRPISLFSIQTVRQLSEELGVKLDKLRFRANLYIDLELDSGFAEEEFVGRQLRVGPRAVIAILDRDARCKMIALDPGTAEANPEIMRRLARAHDGNAGVYGAVLVEGIISPGDLIALVE
jgi:uncharacterized protein YcbX